VVKSGYAENAQTISSVALADFCCATGGQETTGVNLSGDCREGRRPGRVRIPVSAVRLSDHIPPEGGTPTGRADTGVGVPASAGPLSDHIPPEGGTPTSRADMGVGVPASAGPPIRGRCSPPWSGD